MDPTTILLVVAAALAVADWVAVALRWRRPEALLKPAAIAALLAATVVGDVDASVHWLLVAGLALGLVGDIALVRSRPGSADRWFLLGLAAFVLGHGAYIAGFLRFGVRGWEVLAGALVAAGVGGLALPAALRGAVRDRGRELGALIAAYALVLAVMAASAAGTTRLLTAIGGAAFVVSDAVLARERFVRPWTAGRVPVGQVVVMITYHAAQGLIVLGLLQEHWLHGLH